VILIFCFCYCSLYFVTLGLLSYFIDWLLNLNLKGLLCLLLFELYYCLETFYFDGIELSWIEWFILSFSFFLIKIELKILIYSTKVIILLCWNIWSDWIKFVCSFFYSNICLLFFLPPLSLFLWKHFTCI
jgi:hypothetical protein